MRGERVSSLAERLEWGLVPAVPVPFRGDAMDQAAQRSYAAWMSRQPIAGVAVWAHTGRGPHLSADQRGAVLETWREAMPDRIIVAGARDITMAIEARRGRADALLAFPERDDPVKYHARLSRELPVIAPASPPWFSPWMARLSSPAAKPFASPISCRASGD